MKLLHHKSFIVTSIIGLFFLLSGIYLYPLTSGLILLPLDLLISNYGPWYLANVILLKNPYMQDSIVQMYPWKHFTIQSLMHGIIPLWNPYQLMGMPFMASLKPVVFYPFTYLYIFGEINAWHLLLLLQLFLALLWMYLLCRDCKVSISASILASIAFACNSLLIAVMEFGSEGHVILWLPLLVLTTKKFIDQRKVRYLIFFSLALAMSILAGQLQYVGYEMLVVVSFALVYILHQKLSLKLFFPLSISWCLGIGLSALQLVPSIELFQVSYRGVANSYDVFAGSLMPFYHIFRLWAPDLFGNPVSHDATIGYIEHSGYFGVIPLFFALFAMLFIKKNIIVSYARVVSLVAWLASVNGVGQVLYLLHIPLVTSGSGERIFILVLFSGALLAGFGVDAFVQSIQKKQLFSAIGFTLVSFGILGTFFVLEKKGLALGSSITNIKFPLVIVGLFILTTLGYIALPFKKKIITGVFLTAIICITFFDLFRFGYRFLTFSNQKFFYPTLPVVSFLQHDAQYSFARNYGLVEPEIATYFNLYTPETYNPLYLKRSGDLLQALQGKGNEELPVNKYYMDKSGKYFKQTLDFLGVTRIVAKKDVNPALEYFHADKYQADLHPIYHDEQYVVYDNSTALPRYGLYYSTIVVPDDTRTLSLLAGRNVDSRKSIILPESLPTKLTPGKGVVKAITSTANSQGFVAQSDKPALFYISDTFFPGWTATVNNAETKIYRANYNFRAVLIPAGDSTINFMYQPFSFTLGIWISGLSTVLLVLLGLLPKRWKKSFITK